MIELIEWSWVRVKREFGKLGFLFLFFYSFISQVRSDKETGLQLKVVSVRDPSGQADFLFGSGSQSSRCVPLLNIS